ncbi:MAG: pyrimidine dimer DNA glycosylase/endonuclease V [Chthoniobacterales bacterium]
MRLWTVHPRYLDAKGLVALWREGLLAQKVLAGKTRGYTKHPQLRRFQSHTRPLEVIGAYLAHVSDEAERRGYSFDRTRIVTAEFRGRMKETRGQLLFEWQHLKTKLRLRAARHCLDLDAIDCPEAHPIFRIVPGDVREWENRGARSKTRAE